MKTLIAVLLIVAFIAIAVFMAVRIKKSNNKPVGETKTGMGGEYPNKPNYDKTKRPEKE